MESGEGSSSLRANDTATTNEVVLYISNLMETLPRPSEECSIFRVPKTLTGSNPKAYAPQFVSIGPFHRGLKELAINEERKIFGLKKFLRHTGLKLLDVVEKVQSWEERARGYYAEHVNMSSGEFTKMVMLDGCFIVDLMIRTDQSCSNEDELDNIFYGSLSTELYDDLIMLENQLPFFVLEGLFQMYKQSDLHAILEIIQKTFESLVKFGIVESHFPHASPRRKLRHLVDFFRFCFIPPAIKNMDTSGSGDNYISCPSATELCEAGIVICPAGINKCITDISFKDGVLEIPRLVINQSFEVRMRNAVALEKHQSDQDQCVSCYATFMNGLMRNDKDVSILEKEYIITNRMGSVQNISKLFHDLCEHVSVGSKAKGSHLGGICNDLEKHANIGQLPSSSPSPECSIYRVPKRLYCINPRAYTPQLVSFGPFHTNRSDLLVTKHLKKKSFMQKNIDANFLIAFIHRKFVEWSRARRYYAEPIDMNKLYFTTMLLHDGCFILELMLASSKSHINENNARDDTVFQSSSIDLYRDLTMLENQLPLFVLREIYDLCLEHSLSPNPSPISFQELLRKSFLLEKYECPSDILEAKHLVDLLRLYYVPSLTKPLSNTATESDNIRLITPQDTTRDRETESILQQPPPTATELHEVGVVFKAATEAKRITDITFKNGVLQIPPFTADLSFEIRMRNVIAFEQRQYNQKGYASQYAHFLDGLIETEKDVRLLEKVNIITNGMGSQENASKLFNDLSKDVIVMGDYHFGNICNELHEHCENRRNRWMASLRRDYFNTPWAYISFLAAVILLVLTLLQTIYTIAGFRK